MRQRIAVVQFQLLNLVRPARRIIANTEQASNSSADPFTSKGRDLSGLLFSAPILLSLTSDLDSPRRREAAGH